MKKSFYILLFVIHSFINSAFAFADTTVILSKLESVGYIGNNKVALYQNVTVLKGEFRGRWFSIIIDSTDKSKLDSTCRLTLYNSDTTNIPFHYFVGKDLSSRSRYVNFYYPKYRNWISEIPDGKKNDPEIFTYNVSDSYSYLIIPSFGTTTSYAIINSNNIIVWEKVSTFNSNPIFYNLKDLEEGKYILKIMSCHTGGNLKFKVVIKE